MTELTVTIPTALLERAVAVCKFENFAGKLGDELAAFLPARIEARSGETQRGSMATPRKPDKRQIHAG